MAIGPERADGRAAARANALLGRVQLADGHNDLPWALRELAGGRGWSADWAAADLTVRRTDLHTDLVRLRGFRPDVRSVLPRYRAYAHALQEADDD